MALIYDLPVYRDTYQLILKIFEVTKARGQTVRTGTRHGGQAPNPTVMSWSQWRFVAEAMNTLIGLIHAMISTVISDGTVK